MTNNVNMKEVNLKPEKLDARFMPETFDEKSMTVEMVFSTGSRVLRRPFFDEPYFEELSLDQDAVRLDRLNGGAPFLNSHRSDDLDDVIGVVERAWVDGEKGYAVVRFSKREDVRQIVDDVRDGVLRNISVGYRVFKFQEMIENEQEIRTLRAIDWEPFELSLVPIPADAQSQIRSDENNHEENKCQLLLSRGEKMTEETKNGNGEVEETRNAPETTETVVEKVVEVEVEKPVLDQERLDAELAKRTETIEGINELCKKFDVAEEKRKSFIEENKSIDEVRAFVIETLAAKDEEQPTRNENMTDVTVGETGLEKKARAIEEGILFRSGIKKADGSNRYELTDAARTTCNMSLVDMARMFLEEKGINTRNMAPAQVASLVFSTRGTHGTSDFPLILANVLNKTLRDAYQAAPQTFMPFTRMVQANDLREMQRTQFGEGSTLEKVREGENYKHGTVSESAEKYRVEKYGKIVDITEEIIINDDLNAFARMPALFGQRARDLESDLVWGIMTGNPQMADGQNVFSQAHGNLNDGAGGAGAALDEASLKLGRKLMRKQVGLDKMKLNLAPQWLAVPTTLEGDAEKLLAGTTPESTSGFNPFGPSGRTPLSLIVEPRLDDVIETAWNLFGSLGQVDMVELASLRGQEGPQITQKENFETDGISVKIKHWAAAKAIDFRGMYKNDGA